VSVENTNQLSVSYIGDLAHTPPDDVLLVEHDEDYVQVCHVLSHAAMSGAGLKVWVRSKNHFTWLRDFTEQIGFPAGFREMTARLILADRWNVRVPDWLTDAEVLGNSLLRMDVGFREQQMGFADCLLTHLLGSAFQSDALGAENLVEVLKALTGAEAKADFRKYPVLHRCLRDKCEQWAQQSREAWVSEACLLLQGDVGALWQWLSLWACLHTYPERLLEYVLTPKQVVFVRKIPVGAVDDLPLEPSAREQSLTQIEVLFEGVREQVTSSEEFRKIVGWTSGRLIQEYRFVSSLLNGNLFSPSKEDVQVVQVKFRSCPGVSGSEMTSLDTCVMPSRPTLLGPEEERTWQEWVQWTTKEYAPYRSWQVRNNHYDEGLERTVARFSEWFVEEYASIHKDPDLSLTHCLSNLSLSGPEGGLSIVLLIDCLPVTFMPLLDAALRNVGFSRHALHYRFAALPTDTKHNKPHLLSGEWQTTSGDYTAILRTRTVADWNGRQVIYLSNLKALSEMEAPQEPAIVVLNFTDGDELLHSDVESKNTTYEEELYRLFARIAESVSRLSKEWAGAKEHFNVHIVTDHGACRILEEEKRSLDSTVVNKLFADEKHRFAAVDDKQMAAVPDNLWELGHRFRQSFTLDDQVFFLPSGHNTVRRAGRAKGYLHGGVTPEEVIVPTATYKLVRADWQIPAARFLNLNLSKETGRAEFYIQRVVALQIEMQNLNPVDIQIFRASVTFPDTDLKGCGTVVVPAGSVNTLQMDCYFKRAALGENNLEIEINYELSGESYTLPLTLECEFKSAMSRGFSLRDL